MYVNVCYDILHICFGLSELPPFTVFEEDPPLGECMLGSKNKTMEYIFYNFINYA